MNEDIKHLADEISFRLLATKDHEDYDWLREKLFKFFHNDRTTTPS